MNSLKTVEQNGSRRDPFLLAATYVKYTTTAPLKTPSAIKTPIEAPDDLGDASDPRRIFWEYFTMLNGGNVLTAYDIDISPLNLEADEINYLLDWIDRKLIIYDEKKKIVNKIPHDPLLEFKILVTLSEFFYEHPYTDSFLPLQMLGNDLIKQHYLTPPETLRERCLIMLIRTLGTYLYRTANIEDSSTQNVRALLMLMRHEYRDQIARMRPDLYKED